MNKIWGNKDDQLKQQFVIEFQKEVSKLDLAKGQLEINKQEAANPNRKWVTWRECLGYIIVGAVLYQWIILPLYTVICVSIGHPIDLSKTLQINMSDALYILGVMLGADLSPLIVDRFKKK